MAGLLKRFIKAGDDLRINFQTEKTLKNNADKIAYMRYIIEQLKYTDKQLSR